MNEKDCKDAQAASEDVIDNFPLYVNEWGSCQYTFAFETYTQLCELEKKHGRNKVIVKLGISIGLVGTFDKFLKEFKEAILINLAEEEADGEDVSARRVELANVSNVTEALHFLRDQAWDLWAGIPFVAVWVFPELNLDSVSDAPGFGPKFNVLVQNDNYRIGTICWLLKSYGFVEDDEPFKEWDT